MKLAIIDFNRTLYDPDTAGLIDGAYEMLTALRSAGMNLVLVSKQEQGRDTLLQSLGIEEFFDDVLFVAHKDAGLFGMIMDRFGATPQETYVIGDHPHEEIKHGSRMGARTVRLKRGTFGPLKAERPEEEAWRTVSDLWEAVEVIEEHRQHAGGV